ncbi:hypothetical protein [Saccharomonospora piscinae]|uniref:Uncharacterized protein n=1 Tax=Saccharomonospora piscinae TaxID=687388 RepID=A0A1V9A5W3_SACPI|nr:hypothetical protein [Saccharomonospora piscinae]OQO92473.1 hypothetical protein B1813_09775 [Saccharomonospora piscinae]TLW91821.1 hypothetical protein FFT09_12930 [Saccharomonospora piscinae]
MGTARTSDGPRSAGVMPLLAGVVSALALTGAAVYTVTEAQCDSGHYLTGGQHATLVGSCVTGAELEEAGVGADRDRPGTTADTSPSNLRP